MTFFNKKTDVVDIELTPYGRYLLSIGKLKPVFYEFADDDVLYDVAAASGPTESQNQAHDRITKNTPKLKTLYLKTGVESDSPEGYNFQANIPTLNEERENILSNINVAIANVREEEEAVTYNQKGVYAMGRSSYSSDKIPNFQLTMLQGQISGSTHFLREDGLTEGSI